jgi:alkanesulfonate monooxygenase SsuD/methylene tetrahydromethanopterin reductase-like flavin-dependent oxidoreductase (luciferase family)
VGRQPSTPPGNLTSEIARADAISEGRLEVGFARAFLPYEFAHFNVSMDESRARFEEGVAQVRLLLEEESASHEGRFHSFRDVRSMPRPTQKPRPPFWVAATSSPETFVAAGRLGYNVMAIPLASDRLRELLALYRDAWRAAGHAGASKVMLAFHMFCDADRERAYTVARAPLNNYLRILAAASTQWVEGTQSKDYPGYDQMAAALRRENFDSQLASKTAWIGTPSDIRAAIRHWIDAIGAFEIASLQVNFDTIPLAAAERSMRLFAAEVMPHFA